VAMPLVPAPLGAGIIQLRVRVSVNLHAARIGPDRCWLSARRSTGWRPPDAGGPLFCPIRRRIVVECGFPQLRASRNSSAAYHPVRCSLRASVGLRRQARQLRSLRSRSTGPPFLVARVIQQDAARPVVRASQGGAISRVRSEGESARCCFTFLMRCSSRAFKLGLRLKHWSKSRCASDSSPCSSRTKPRFT